MKYICKAYIPGIPFFIGLPILVFSIYILINAFSNPFVRKFKDVLITGIIAMAIGLAMTLLTLFQYISLYKNVYKQYKSDNYVTISGQVKNLDTIAFLGNGRDTFEVDDVKFEIGNSLAPGYQKEAAYGGMVSENDICVEIKYVPHNGQNYIMEITRK